MFYNEIMDSLDKLALFAAAMRVEDPEPSDLSANPATCPAAGRGRSESPSDAAQQISSYPVTLAHLPNGQRIPLLKTVLTSACERNCYYCCFRAGRDFQRESFTPDELAAAYLRLYQAGVVKGMFLSSGVAGGGVRTQDRLIAAAEILRQKYHHQGYLHLKIMPGAERAQVERAMSLADRVSVNLEGPTTQRLAALAPQKMFMDELLQPLKWVQEIRQNQPAHLGWKGHWPSSTTQFVLGAVGESDIELLQATEYLHNTLHLARVYFSPFNPVRDTPFEDRPPVNLWREHRLYQASFLLRDYGFSLEDMPFAPGGDLPLEKDPKLAWAQLHLNQAPIEINRADLHQLLRVPGIGLRGARSILQARRQHLLHSLDELKALGILTQRAAPFVLLNGRRPVLQMALF